MSVTDMGKLQEDKYEEMNSVLNVLFEGSVRSQRRDVSKALPIFIWS